MDKNTATLIYSVAVYLTLCSVPAWTLSFTVEPSNETVAIGGSLILNCQATDSGSAPVYISWQKDGTWLNNPAGMPWRYLANGSLFYQTVSKQDVGKFRCGAVISNTNNIIYSRMAEVKLAYINPVFLTPPSNQSVRVGTAAHLDCVTGESLPHAEVYWEKDGNKFTAGREQLHQFPSNQLTSSSLLIQNTTYSNTGWYRCVAVNPLLPNLPRQSQSAYLNIIPSKDMPHFQVQPANMVAAEHADAALQCVILGVPAPQVSWMHNGQPLQNTANRYVLRNGSLYFSAPINRSFAGQYVCTGKNSVGSISSSPILFNIAYFEFDFLVNPSNKTATVEDSVSLKCGPPQSFPPRVAIYWFHNYQEIQQGNGITIEQSGTLTFTSIKKSDGGKYFCSGVNPVSQESRTSSVAYVTVNVPPSFLLRPTNSSVIQHQALVLHCTAAGSPQPSLTWTKDGLPVDSSRVRISADGSLSINTTTVRDAGKYTCTATNVAGSADASAIVAIHVVPSPAPSKVPKNATRTVGESVTFVCEFDGIPKPTVTWFHVNGRTQVEVNASANYVLTSISLEIRQVKKQEEGTYICEGKNSAGISQVSVYLKVQVPVSLDSRPVNVTLNESSTASFQCSASGDPSPIVVWYKDDSRLVSGGRIVIGSNSLTILQASRADTGQYSCNVSNGLAFHTAIAFLLVQVVPNITTISVPDLVGLGSNATLACSATGVPAPRVTWQREGVSLGGPRVVTSGGGTVTLIHMNRADNGSYTCVAENAAGRDTKSGEITVQVPPSPPVFLSAIPVSSTAIKLSWKPGFDGHSPITGYSVSVKRGNGSYYQVVEKSPITTYVVDSLAPYENYSFSITAWNAISHGEAAVVQNRTLEDAPSAPRSVSASPLNATAMRVVWGTPEDPNGVVTWYEIQYKRSDNDLVSARQLSADSQRQAVIGGLAPYTLYEFSVRAATGQQNKSWGNFTAHSERTKEAGPSEAPQNVLLSSVSSTSINITWKAVPVSSHNGIIRKYIISFKPIGPYHFDNVTMVTVLGNDTFNHALNNLHPWTNYSVAVEAFTVESGPKSVWDDDRTQEAAPVGPPTNVTLVAESEYSIMVYMTYPEEHLRNGVIRGFIVQYKEKRSPISVNTSNTSARLDNLMVYTKYAISVAAFTSVGVGVASSTKDIFTQEGEPGPVEGLSLIVDNYDIITVSWDVPKVKNGKIQGYMVYYNSTDGKSSGSVTTSQLSVKLRNLSPNTTYEVRVIARTNKGYGDGSAENSTTSIPSVTLSAGKYGIITIIWKALQPSQEVQYRVHFKPAGSNNVSTVTPGDLRVELQNLTAHVNYTIWVMAVSTDGKETFITTLTATTYVPTLSTPSPTTVDVEGETGSKLTERDLIIVIVCVGVIVILLIVTAVYFVVVRPRTTQGQLSSRKGRSRLRSPELELQGGGLENVQEDISTGETEDSFGSFDVDDWHSTISGQQESEKEPQYAAAHTGPKKSPVVELRNKRLSLGSQDSFYDQPYSSIEELGAGFSSFGPPPPPGFRSNAEDNRDTDSNKTLPVDFPKVNRLSFTNELYRDATKKQADVDPDELLDKYLDTSGAIESDGVAVHGIENKGARSDSAEPMNPEGAHGEAKNSDECPVYAMPDMTKKKKNKKPREGDEKSTTASSASSYHLVDENGKDVHHPSVVYDERTNL